jgi:D-glycero-beta-D-manno-heptose-7-phosphate kinase
MNDTSIARSRVRNILTKTGRIKVLVVGDVMLDHFIWGSVGRISPEAPVPVLELERESFMPGGAANVARNLTALGVPTDLVGLVGTDLAADQLKRLLRQHGIGCRGLLSDPARPTSTKTRVVAHKQQVVRIDREGTGEATVAQVRSLSRRIEAQAHEVAAVIVGDYGKGAITQALLDQLKELCRARAVWLSLDPKPTHHLNLHGLSLITPNRKEAFELADVPDTTRQANPLADQQLLKAADCLLKEFRPAVLLITLGELGMLLCERERKPFHIRTVAQEVFDVSGAGDTVIACFTMAIAAGATPVEAALISNHAAGIVVGKIGTATVSAPELLASFRPNPQS